MKKRILCLLLMIVVILSIASCNQSSQTESIEESKTSDENSNTVSNAEKTNVNVLTIAGPTGMGMAKMMDLNKSEGTRNNYVFNITSAPTDVMTAIVTGEADIAACPINLAAKIYSKTEGNVQVLAINTLGVLYVVTNGTEINSFEDLNGKTIVTSGKGATPEYAMKYLFEAFGIEATLDFVDDFSTAANMVASGEIEIALLAEPSVSSARAKNNELVVALNITEIWRESGKTGKIPEIELAQGCVIVRKEYAEQNPAAVKKFLADYKESVDFMTSEQNLEAAALLCETYQIVPKAAIAKMALPRCNIVCIVDDEMKAIAEGNLKVFHQYDPSSIGGKMPDEAFYYVS